MRRAVARIIAYILLYVAVSAVANYLLYTILPDIGYALPQADFPYVNVLLALAFGYLIVSAFSTVVYWSLRVRMPHHTAAPVRNLFTIVGFGALAAAIAGGVAGGASGVALGGFLGIVVGYASQQVLGQALAGLFLLITRPVKPGDRVTVSSEDGTVDDLSTLFTTILKEDGTKVLVPNNLILGTKIFIKPEQKP